MRVGFALPQFGACASKGAEVARFARAAESLGATSLWVGDRLLAATEPSVGYGGSDTIPAEFRASLDPLTVLTAAAAATSEVTLGTNVLNLPWYPPALLARSLTTLDVVSGGRLVPGFGAGWSPEEFEAVGVPFAERGARMDEYLDALERLWGPSPVSYRGELVSVPEAHMEIEPVQRPRPPVYLGAFSPPALRRVGRRADGWLPVIVVGAHVSAEAINQDREVIGQAAAAAGRTEEVPAVLRVNTVAGVSVEQIVDAAGTVCQQTGIDELFIDPMYLISDPDESLELAAAILQRLH